MATSAAMGTSNPFVNYTITITENSTNVAANTSNVTVSVRFYRTNTGYETWGSGTVWCKIDGQTYTSGVGPHQKITSGGIVLFSKTLDIRHNADGTKHLETSAWISLDTPLTSSERGYGQTLTTLARATSPQLTPDTQMLGKVLNISLPRASSSFTHTVRYAFGSLTGTIATKVGTSATFVLPEELATQIPNNDSGWGEVFVDTYNGNSFVGTTRAKFTAMIPDSMGPVIKSVITSDTNAEIAAKFGTLVQNRSKIRVAIDVTGQYGSTIKSVRSVIGGLTYNGSQFDTEIITQSGSVAIETTVVDSRGKSKTYSKTVIVAKYEPPKINSFSVVRGNQYGNEDEGGTYAVVNLNYVISALDQKNSKSCRVEYKKSTDQVWSVLATKDEYVYNGKFNVGNALEPEYYYSFRLILSDYFGSVTSDGNGVSDDFTLMNWNESGKGIALGKISEKDELEIAIETEFTRDVNISGAKLKLEGKTFLDVFYPVGSIYLSTNPSNPESLFGGNWERWGNGRVPVGVDESQTEFDVAEKTGGSKSVTLTGNQLPSHNHNVPKPEWYGVTSQTDTGFGLMRTKNPTKDGSDGFTSTYTGQGEAHDNLQPYITCYMWVRIA